MTTNHVQQLKPGEGCYAFFLNAQGRILGDVNLFCFEDHFLLDTEPETRHKLFEHLDRYIIADDVTLTDETDRMATIAIEGPEAAQASSQTLLADPGDTVLDRDLRRTHRRPRRFHRRGRILPVHFNRR